MKYSQILNSFIVLSFGIFIAQNVFAKNNVSSARLAIITPDQPFAIPKKMGYGCAKYDYTRCKLPDEAAINKLETTSMGMASQMFQSYESLMTPYNKILGFLSQLVEKSSNNSKFQRIFSDEISYLNKRSLDLRKFYENFNRDYQIYEKDLINYFSEMKKVLGDLSLPEKTSPNEAIEAINVVMNKYADTLLSYELLVANKWPFPNESVGSVYNILRHFIFTGYPNRLLTKNDYLDLLHIDNSCLPESDMIKGSLVNFFEGIFSLKINFTSEGDLNTSEKPLNYLTLNDDFPLISSIVDPAKPLKIVCDRSEDSVLLASTFDRQNKILKISYWAVRTIDNEDGKPYWTYKITMPSRSEVVSALR